MNRTFSKSWADDGGGGEVPEHETVLFHGAAAAYIDEALQGPDAPDAYFEVTDFMPNDDAVYRPADVCVAPFAADPLPRPDGAVEGGVAAGAAETASLQIIYWLDRAHEAFGVCEVAVPSEMHQRCTCTFRPLLAGIDASSEIAVSADGSKVYFLESSAEDHRGGRLWAYMVGGGEVTEVLTGLCRPRGLHVTLGNDLLWIEDSYSALEGPAVRLLPASCARGASLDNIQDDKVVDILRFPVKGKLVVRGKYTWWDSSLDDDDGAIVHTNNEEQVQQREEFLRKRETELVKFGRPEQLVILSDESIIVSVRDTSTSSSSLLLFPSPAIMADFSSDEEAATTICDNPLLPDAAMVPTEIQPTPEGYIFNCHAWLACELPPTRRLAVCPKTGAVLIAGCGAVEMDGNPTSLLRLVRKDKPPERLMGGFASSLCLDRNGNVFLCPARGGGLRAFWHRGTDRWSLLAAKRAAKVPLPDTARSEFERFKSKSHINTPQRDKKSTRGVGLNFTDSLLNTSGLSIITTPRKESSEGAWKDGTNDKFRSVFVNNEARTDEIHDPETNKARDDHELVAYKSTLQNASLSSLQGASNDNGGIFVVYDEDADEDDNKEPAQIAETMASISSSLIENSESLEVTVPLFLDRTTNNEGNAKNNEGEATQSSVAVVLRCRPLLTKEKESKLRKVVKCDMNRDEVNIMGKPRTFKFSRVYDETTTQRRVFHETIAPLVDKVMAGYSATCFAYGPTGSGKTFTMEGPPAELRTWSEFSQTVQSTGMITRAIHMLFHSLARTESVLSHRVSVSHLEVYNENLYDLLAVSGAISGASGTTSLANTGPASPEKPTTRVLHSASVQRVRTSSPVAHRSASNDGVTGACPQLEKTSNVVTVNESDEVAAARTALRPTGTQLAEERLLSLMRPLKLLEDSRTGVQKIPGLTDMDVKTPMDIFRVLKRSTRARFTAETKLNRHSSRSHSIFAINVEMKCYTREQGNVMKRGKLSLVDLCGSENIKKSGSEGQRATEAGHIGQSLLVLGRVIRSIIQHNPHVPYRDSKLTRMLSNALGGDAYTVLILNSAPGVNQQEETMNTLKYAELAQGIVNNPQAHVEQLPADDEEMEEARLQKQQELEALAEAGAEEIGNSGRHNMTAWVRPWSASVPIQQNRTLRNSASAAMELTKGIERDGDSSLAASASAWVILESDRNSTSRGPRKELPPLRPETLHLSQGQPDPRMSRVKIRYAFHRETDDWVRENVFGGDGNLSFHAASALREIFDRHDLDRDGLLSVQEMAGFCALWPTDVSMQSDVLSLVPARKHYSYKLNFAALVEFVSYLGQNDSLAVRHLFSTCGYSLSLHLIDPAAREAARDRKRTSRFKSGGANNRESRKTRRGSLHLNTTSAGGAAVGKPETGNGGVPARATVTIAETEEKADMVEVPPATCGNTDFGRVLLKIVKENPNAKADEEHEGRKGWTTKVPMAASDGVPSARSNSQTWYRSASWARGKERKTDVEGLGLTQRSTQRSSSRRREREKNSSFNSVKNSSWQSADARKQFASVADMAALPKDSQVSA